MRGGDLLGFAAGALRGHRLRTSLSLLGVAIGVAAVLLLTSLGEGARSYVTGEFALLGSNLVIVLPGRSETTGIVPVAGGVPHDLTLEDVEALRRRVSSLASVAPLAVGGLTARFGERSRDLTVAGVTAEWKDLRRLSLREGSFIPKGEPSRAPRVCVIGAKVAEELFPGRSPVGELLRLGDEKFRVAGVLVSRGVSLGLDLDEVALIPIGHHLRMFDRRSVFRVLCEARSPRDVDGARRAILSVLRERHDGEEDVTVFTQDAVMKTFGKVLAILTAALAGTRTELENYLRTVEIFDVDWLAGMSVGVFPLQSRQHGHLLDAGRAPGRPEIQQQRPAVEIRGRHRIAGGIGEAEIGTPLADQRFRRQRNRIHGRIRDRGRGRQRRLAEAHRDDIAAAGGQQRDQRQDDELPAHWASSTRPRCVENSAGSK